MGMISSGEIADFVLYILLELGFLLLPHVRERFHIRGYYKFKDDLFIVAGGPEWSIAALFRMMQVTALFFFFHINFGLAEPTACSVSRPGGEQRC